MSSTPTHRTPWKNPPTDNISYIPYRSVFAVLKHPHPAARHVEGDEVWLSRFGQLRRHPESALVPVDGVLRAEGVAGPQWCIDTRWCESLKINCEGSQWEAMTSWKIWFYCWRTKENLLEVFLFWINGCKWNKYKDENDERFHVSCSSLHPRGIVFVACKWQHVKHVQRTSSLCSKLWKAAQPRWIVNPALVFWRLQCVARHPHRTCQVVLEVALSYLNHTTSDYVQLVQYKHTMFINSTSSRHQQTVKPMLALSLPVSTPTLQWWKHSIAMGQVAVIGLKCARLVSKYTLKLLMAYRPSPLSADARVMRILARDLPSITWKGSREQITRSISCVFKLVWPKPHRVQLSKCM